MNFLGSLGLGQNSLGSNNFDLNLNSRLNNFNYGTAPPLGADTNYVSDLNPELSFRDRGKAPSTTFSQDYWGTGKNELFGRNLQHNKANDLAAGNRLQAQSVYGSRIANGDTPPPNTSLGTNQGNESVPQITKLGTL